MKNAILIHGTCNKTEYFSNEDPSLSNSHWFPWLQKQLIIRDVFTQTPEMLDAYLPDYNKWKKEFERFEINEESILIGHSCGGGFLVRWLTENKVKVKKLILVAPWLDPYKTKAVEFFDFVMDPELTDRTEIHMLVSKDDEEDIQISVREIMGKLPNTKLHEFEDMGHFTLGEMGRMDFPELLEIAVGS